jgi:hypothetical protein
MVGYLYVPITTWFGHLFGKSSDKMPTEPISNQVMQQVSSIGPERLPDLRSDEFSSSWPAQGPMSRDRHMRDSSGR